jgi:hypothetical protein
VCAKGRSRQPEHGGVQCTSRAQWLSAGVARIGANPCEIDHGRAETIGTIKALTG